MKINLKHVTTAISLLLAGHLCVHAKLKDISNISQEPSTLWVIGTNTGTALQWTVPTGTALPMKYEIRRSPSGKNRWTTIGSVSRIPEHEWTTLAIDFDRPTLSNLISEATNSVDVAARNNAIEKLRSLSLLKSDPYILLLGLSFSDTTCRQGVQYDYAVMANGIKTGSKSSMLPYKITSLNPVDFTCWHTESRNVLKWNSSEAFSKGIRYYNIYKKNYSSKSLVASLPLIKNSTKSSLSCYSTFEDFHGEEIDSYQISQVDVFGREFEQVNTVAVMAKKPILISPQITHIETLNNLIKVHWVNVDSNIASSVGYNIYRYNVSLKIKSRVNSKVIHPTSNFYIDTVGSTNSDFLQYFVRTVDANGVESLSSFEYSTPSPDYSPPVNSGIVQSQLVYTTISINWARSVSKDVKGYELARSVHPEKGFESISSTLISDTTYSDIVPTGVEDLPNIYWYRLRSVDSRGNKSEWSSSVPAQIKSNSPILIETPFIEKITFSNNSVTLTWDTPKQGSSSIKGYFINRYEDSTLSPITLNKDLLDSKTYTYTDFSIKQGKVYWYELVAQSTNFVYSTPSNRVPVYCGEYKNLKAPFINKVSNLKEGVLLTWRWGIESPNIPGTLAVERSLDGATFTQVAIVSCSSEGKFLDQDTIITNARRIFYRLKLNPVQGVQPIFSATEVVTNSR